MRWTRWAPLVILGAGLAVAAGTERGSIGLPKPLSAYGGWSELTLGPEPVPWGRSVLCMPVAVLRPEEQRKQYGPHADRWARVFANPLAFEALKAGEAGEFPAGSIIVKEKLLERESTGPEGVAFMIKHPKGELPESAGWEFRYYPAPAGARYEGCVSCHRVGARKDYVFTVYDPTYRQ